MKGETRGCGGGGGVAAETILTGEKGKGKDEGKVVQKKTYVYDGFRCSSDGGNEDWHEAFVTINKPNHRNKNLNWNRSILGGNPYSFSAKITIPELKKSSRREREKVWLVSLITNWRWWELSL